MRRVLHASASEVRAIGPQLCAPSLASPAWDTVDISESFGKVGSMLAARTGCYSSRASGLALPARCGVPTAFLVGEGMREASALAGNRRCCHVPKWRSGV